jgi:hypothetical protein
MMIGDFEARAGGAGHRAEFPAGEGEEMILREAMFGVSCSVLVLGCSAELTPAQEREEIADNLAEAGFPAGAITASEGRVYVGGDIHVTLEASRELIEPVSPGPEHYRTANLVSGKARICINPTSTFSSYAALSNGLNLAIGNYNALPLVFDFVRGPATGCDANITIATATGTGGSAGFPSGGFPYNQISIGTGLASYSVDTIEHIITHEIGHTIGLCHTDGGGSMCLFILGSPTTDPSSVFNSTFPVSATGEFSSADVNVLNYLY